MKYRMHTAAIALLLILASRLHAQELGSWILSTDRSANPLIEEVLASPSLEVRLDAARAVGMRKEPFVADLVDFLIGRFRGPKRHEEELVLRVLLDGVFRRSLPEEDLRLRIAENLPAVELLAAHLPGLGGPLARESYRMLARVGGGRMTGALMVEGRRLVEDLWARNGYSEVEEADRLMAFLDAVEYSRDDSFAPIVAAILESTRTREVGRDARRVLNQMFSGQAPSEQSR